jgi:hypothetical protein
VKPTARANDFIKSHFLLHLNEISTIYFNSNDPPTPDTLNILRKGLKLSLIARRLPASVTYVVGPEKAVVRLVNGKNKFFS